MCIIFIEKFAFYHKKVCVRRANFKTKETLWAYVVIRLCEETKWSGRAGESQTFNLLISV